MTGQTFFESSLKMSFPGKTGFVTFQHLELGRNPMVGIMRTFFSQPASENMQMTTSLDFFTESHFIRERALACEIGNSQ